MDMQMFVQLVWCMLLVVCRCVGEGVLWCGWILAFELWILVCALLGVRTLHVGATLPFWVGQTTTGNPVMGTGRTVMCGVEC